MNGLKIYTRPPELEDNTVFYSRREGGPFYRWSFEEKHGCWQVARMPAYKVTHMDLALARWNLVPLALRAKLRDHYVE